MKLGSPDDPMVVLYQERIAEAQEFGMTGVVEALQRNLEGYKGTIGSLAEKKVRVAREAMNYTYQGFAELSGVTCKRLTELVEEALQNGPLVNTWKSVDVQWLAVVGPFDSLTVAYCGDVPITSDQMIDISMSNSNRMVWLLKRP